MSSVSILVLEDNRPNAVAYRAVLESMGWTVLLAENAANGIEQAKRASPDVIVVDVLLPDMTGFEVVKALRQDASLLDTPILMCSAYETEQMADTALRVGCQAFLTKPVSAQALVEKVEELLRADLRPQSKAPAS
jgi:CheY-like chemotaxis protein